jgi:acetyl esterase/lipase
MRLLLLAGFLSVCAIAADSSTAEKLQIDYNIPLWAEGKVPDAIGTEEIDKPFLTVVLPPEDKRTGAAMVVCPGGGNTILVAHGEGMAIAERLNEWGVAAFILSYRLAPRYPKQEVRMLDGQRAIQMVRQRASEWKVDPNRIGVIGFSAGGVVVRNVSAMFLPGDPASDDPIARVSSRPNFAALIYGPGTGYSIPGESLPSFPPTFILASDKDAGGAVMSARFYLDLHELGIPVELHIYQKGRHGFATGETNPVLSDWMGRLEHWMDQVGFLHGVH